jgi:hypothetical protein
MSFFTFTLIVEKHFEQIPLFLGKERLEEVLFDLEKDGEICKAD